jgi:Serine-threonine protein kinase 19
MSTDDYYRLIERQLNETNLSSLAIEKTRLKQRFIHQVLSTTVRLSIDKNQLENEHQITSNGIHLLIQIGLLLPKDIDQYWFSIPNLTLFIVCLDKGRHALRQILSRRTYRELSMDEFRLCETTKTCRLGFDYHIYDLIGANLVHLIDTPTRLGCQTRPREILVQQ